MSYWPHISSGPAEDAPPLPPRNDGHDLVPTPDAVPRPILPPRPPVRIQRKSVPSTRIQSQTSPAQTGHPVITGQLMTPQHTGHHQYSSAEPGISRNQTPYAPDISHLFPDGKIPPPPPLPAHLGLSGSSQASLYTNRQNTAVVSTGFQPLISSSMGAHVQTINQVQNATHQPFPIQTTPTSRDSWQHMNGIKDSTANTNANANDGLARRSLLRKEAPHATVNDMEVMDKTFQTMQLANSSEATRSYAPEQSSNPAPTVQETVTLPIQQSASTRSLTIDASTTSPIQSQAETKECISTHVTFAATWYTHHRAPEFPICANCYDNHISGSRFEGEFQGIFREDGKPRACRFASPRMKNSLWELALSSGSLDTIVEYLILRPTILDCAGQGGMKGDVGVKWYRTRNNDIPALVVCQACYEDHILSHPKFAVDHFQPSAVPHESDQTWSCDMAVPYIYREYRVRALTNDWQSFVQGTAARMLFAPCPGDKTVYPDGKKWFTPVGGPQGLLICVACYCDYVLLTGQDSRWQDAGENLVSLFGVSVCCYFGKQFNVRALAARTLDTNDYASFWKALDIVNRSPTCTSKMQNATWYTLQSNPAGFEICQACYVTIAEPMGVGHHFAPKAGIPPESSITCSFNPVIARFPVYMNKLLEMVYKQDPGPLEEFIKVYAFLPICRRDSYVENARWFGWKECTICSECHHEFIRGTALADAMPHQGTQVGGGVMCEMYSPRMRQLYLAACASDPPDPKPLLEYSVQRRAVWAETMPQARQIMNDIQLKIARQSVAMNNSMFYTWSGNLWQNALPLEQTSGSAAIGYGHHNHMQIKGAEYGRQATAIGNEILGSPAHVADELERRWRAVE